jgi:hypothetical protein
VDDANSSAITITGSWKKQTRRSYGPSMLVTDTSAAGEASVKFRPAIKKAGRYSIYTYLPKLQGMADEIRVSIHDGKRAHQKNIRPNEIKVAGQTTGEWIWLGDYDLTIRSAPYVQISGSGSHGLVAADAVLLRFVE